MDAISSAQNTLLATITLRIIKSFEYRTEKSLVLHGVDLGLTVKQLKDQAYNIAQTHPSWKAYRNLNLDTLKIYTKAHGSKTSNLIINLDHDELILGDETALLVDMGIENETEMSFFAFEAYQRFKTNPVTKWA